MTQDQIRAELAKSAVSSKPCPFCGGLPIMEKELRGGCENGQPDAWAYFVRCRSCASQGGWGKSETSAIRWWEMREGK